MMLTSPSPGRRAGAMPFQKYRSFPCVELQDRTWPNTPIERPPRWCSVDLRDGNQALIDPMNVDEKMAMYQLLLDIGFNEIEVGFPAASQMDFDFCRTIIEDDLIPPGTLVQVLCQARPELIERTVDALRGAEGAIFHLYNSTSTLQRDVVFNMDRAGIVDLAVKGTELVREITRDLGDTNVTFEYSPESFTGTELDFAIGICDEVANTWGATPEQPIIVNLPSTVEMATPNIYADQIEYFCRNFLNRDRAVISLHTHNDRGTGIAATELALMAGAERVEGTLFGNGERTGNCDIMTMAMNLFSQGVDPELDFRDMPRIRQIAEEVTKIRVHERHPYAGDLVFTAFSGSHQDAIKKGMAVVKEDHWEVPYLPIDPADVGSSYKESVRVNSQSGKGGVGFILEQHFGISLPREMLQEFAKQVQVLTEDLDREVRRDEILQALFDTFEAQDGPYALLNYELNNAANDTLVCEGLIQVSENEVKIQGQGSGPIEAFVNAMVATLNEPLNVAAYHEHALRDGDVVGKDAQAIGIVSIEFGEGSVFGVGRSKNTVTASLLAIISAINRRWSQRR